MPPPVGDPADHVRADRRGEHLERRDQQQHPGRRPAVQPDRRADHDQQHAEHLRLGAGVHPGQDVGEAHQPQPRGQAEERPGEQAARPPRRPRRHARSSRPVPAHRRPTSVAVDRISMPPTYRATETEPTNASSDTTTSTGTTVGSRSSAAYTARPAEMITSRMSVATTRSSSDGPEREPHQREQRPAAEQHVGEHGHDGHGVPPRHASSGPGRARARRSPSAVPNARTTRSSIASTPACCRSTSSWSSTWSTCRATRAPPGPGRSPASPGPATPPRR